MTRCVCEKLAHVGIPCGGIGCECHKSDIFRAQAPMWLNSLDGQIVMTDVTIVDGKCTLEFKDEHHVELMKQHMLYSSISGLVLSYNLTQAIPKE